MRGNKDENKRKILRETTGNVVKAEGIRTKTREKYCVRQRET
jgi:hypothetical protein